MEPYIHMNTELRKKAASGFEKEPLQVDEPIGLREDHGEPAEAG